MPVWEHRQIAGALSRAGTAPQVRGEPQLP